MSCSEHCNSVFPAVTTTDGHGPIWCRRKLAGISVALRLEIWSRQNDQEPWLYTYIDLQEIEAGRHVPGFPSPRLPISPQTTPIWSAAAARWSSGQRRIGWQCVKPGEPVRHPRSNRN